MQITSTTDTAEQVSAAMATTAAAVADSKQDASEASPVEEKPEPAPESDPAKKQTQEEQPKEEKDEEKRGGKRLQKRFHDLTSEIRDLRAKLQEKEAAPPEKSGAASPAAEHVKPKAEDFETYDLYLEARDEWVSQEAVVKATEALTKQQREAAARELAQAVTETFNEQVAAAKAKYSDWNEVFEAVEAPLTPTMQQAIVETPELGAELAYELAKNPTECERIAGLSPAAQIREIGKLQAKIEAKLKPAQEQKPTASNAPPPVRPVAGNSTASTKKPEEMNYPEYKAWRSKGGK